MQAKADECDVPQHKEVYTRTMTAAFRNGLRNLENLLVESFGPPGPQDLLISFYISLPCADSPLPCDWSREICALATNLRG